MSKLAKATTDVQALENLIDRHGLADVIAAISEIAYEKAEHVASNWQDQTLAKLWRAAGERVLKASIAVERIELP